jgi:hypothetical protein
MPEKVLLLLASSFALAYAILNSDISLMSNYGPILALDIIAFLMRLYYVYKNKNEVILIPSSSPNPDPESQMTLSEVAT